MLIVSMYTSALAGRVFDEEFEDLLLFELFEFELLLFLLVLQASTTTSNSPAASHPEWSFISLSFLYSTV